MVSYSQLAQEHADSDDAPRSAGRPRSEESRRAILDSTRRLLTHMSVQKLSIEAIAKKAGVGKTTIYRWWPNKQAVVMEAILHQPGFMNILPASATAFEGIKAQTDKLMRQMTGKSGRVVAEIIGDAQGDPEALRTLIDGFFQERYNALARFIQEGKQNGEFAADLDAEAAIDVILGPVFFRLISGQDFDSAFEQSVSKMLYKALAA